MNRIFSLQLFVYEYIHKCGYVHADLKGSHILLGYANKSQSYLIDFSSAARYACRKYQPEPEKLHYGTPEYSSLDAHMVIILIEYFRSNLYWLNDGMFSYGRASLQCVGIYRYWVTIWFNGLVLRCHGNQDLASMKYNNRKRIWSPIWIRWIVTLSINNVHVRFEHLIRTKIDLRTNIDSVFIFISVPIFDYLKYTTQLIFNEQPDYEKCRTFFIEGLNSLNKKDIGELEFHYPKTYEIELELDISSDADVTIQIQKTKNK